MSAPTLLSRDTFPVTIDFSKYTAGRVVDEMLVEGRYFYPDAEINSENFPVAGTGIVRADIRLHCIDFWTPTDGVMRQLDEKGLQPISVEYTLALGAEHKYLQPKFSIVGLGSIFMMQFKQKYHSYKRPCASHLWGSGLARSVSLLFCDQGMEGNYIFGAIPKIS